MYRVCIANMQFRYFLEQCNRLEDLEKQSKKQDSAEQTKKNGSSIRTKKHLKNIPKNTLKSLQNPSRMSGMNLLWTPSEFLGLTTVQAAQKARFLDPHFGAKIIQNRKKKRPKKHACFGTLPEGHQSRSGGPNPPQKHAKSPPKASQNAKNPQPRKPWFFLGRIKVFEGSDPPKSSQKWSESS